MSEDEKKAILGRISPSTNLLSMQAADFVVEAASEIEEIKGYVGNYQVKVRKKTPYVDWTKCTGCGECMEKCPKVGS